MAKENIKNNLLVFQKNEITESLVYRNLAGINKGANKKILERISKDEAKHYGYWKKYTKQDVEPDRLKVLKYTLLSKIAGITFAVKLMEKGEVHAQKVYSNALKAAPEARHILADEERHEKNLIGIISEEKLNYVGSMVLGLNDALVELTGTIAGLTLALQNTKIVAMAALITGIAAALSMSSSEYLSKKSEAAQNALKSSFYTGITYFFTVIALVLPYFLISSYYIALACTILIAITIIFIFTYFISVAKDQPFGKRFFEMASIGMGVAAISFFIGFALRHFLGVDA